MCLHSYIYYYATCCSQFLQEQVSLLIVCQKTREFFVIEQSNVFIIFTKTDDCVFFIFLYMISTTSGDSQIYLKACLQVSCPKAGLR